MLLFPVILGLGTKVSPSQEPVKFSVRMFIFSSELIISDCLILI